MSEEEKIVEFLSSKPGYIKTGAKKLGRMLNISDIDLIKRVRKDLKQSVNYVVSEPIKELDTIFTVTKDLPNPELVLREQPVKPLIEFDAEITPELIEALRLALAKPSNVGIENIPTVKQTMFKPKLPLDRSEFKTPGVHLVMGCNHVPFHDVDLHEGIRELIRDLGDKMVGFHILGDFCDINSLSFHDRGKFTAVPGLTLDNEYLEANAELEKFENALSKTVVDKSFIYGNHEDRVFRYNSDMQNAKNPALLPHDALSLRERGYSVKERWSQDYITLGDMDMFHGIYFNIHNAKKHLDTFNRSSMYVHTHRSQMYREGPNAAYNIGACANFRSPAFNYATRAMKNAWANGFALVHVDAKGQHYVSQIDVQNSKFFHNGKQY